MNRCTIHGTELDTGGSCDKCRRDAMYHTTTTGHADWPDAYISREEHNAILQAARDQYDALSRICEARKASLDAALSREAKLRDVLREVCRFYSKKDGFNREGYSLFVDPDTALRDINYRDAKLWPTVEEAIDGAIAALNSQPSEV